MAAIGTLQTANDFLTPRDPMTEHLNEVKPLYTAVFTFNDPNNIEAGDIRLMKTGRRQPMPTQQCRRMSRSLRSGCAWIGQWDSELHPRYQPERASHWHSMAIRIHAAQSIEEDKLPTGFSDFGNDVKPEANAARKAANPAATEVSFVTYRPSIVQLKHLKHLEQRLDYCYGVGGTDYTVELSRFQHREFPPRNASITEPTVFESRWA